MRAGLITAQTKRLSPRRAALLSLCVADFNALQFLMRNSLQIDSLDCDRHSSLDVEPSIHCAVSSLADGLHELIVSQSMIEVVLVGHDRTSGPIAACAICTAIACTGCSSIGLVLLLLGLATLLDEHGGGTALRQPQKQRSEQQRQGTVAHEPTAQQD